MKNYLSAKYIDNYTFAKIKRGKIHVRGFDDQGRDVLDIIPFEPTLYYPSNKTVDATSIYGDNLKEMKFKSIPEANAWKKRQKDSMIEVYGDIGAEHEYIASLPKTKAVTKDDVRILYYDIETTTEHGPIDVIGTPEMVTCISAYDTKNHKCHIFSQQGFEADYKFDEFLKSYEVVEHVVDTEVEMLMDFFEYWQDVDPHIISGYNIDLFDNVYIYNRANKVMTEGICNMLSPFGDVSMRTFEKFGKENYTVTFFGVASYDYYEVYTTFTYHSMPDYKLDTVAQKEVGAPKLHYDGSFREFYTNEWDKFVTYNIRDTILVVELDKATDLISVGMTLAYLCGVNLDDTFGTVKKLDVLTYNFAKQQNMIIPPNKRQETVSYPGGYVMQPKSGKYESVCSYDLASLYPHIIMQHNISPETLVHPHLVSAEVRAAARETSVEGQLTGTDDLSALKGTPYSITPNGAIFDHTVTGILPNMMDDLYQKRKAEKKLAFEFWQKSDLARKEMDRRGIKA